MKKNLAVLVSIEGLADHVPQLRGGGVRMYLHSEYVLYRLGSWRYKKIDEKGQGRVREEKMNGKTHARIAQWKMTYYEEEEKEETYLRLYNMSECMYLLALYVVVCTTIECANRRFSLLVNCYIGFRMLE